MTMFTATISVMMTGCMCGMMYRAVVRYALGMC